MRWSWFRIENPMEHCFPLFPASLSIIRTWRFHKFLDHRFIMEIAPANLLFLLTKSVFHVPAIVLLHLDWPKPPIWPRLNRIPATVLRRTQWSRENNVICKTRDLWRWWCPLEWLRWWYVWRASSGRRITSGQGGHYLIDAHKRSDKTPENLILSLSLSLFILTEFNLGDFINFPSRLPLR